MDATAVVNGPKDAGDWYGIDWDQAERDVGRLRQRIFAASQAGDLKKVRNLQRLMLRSRANALVSVRRVTEVNAGRKTAIPEDAWTAIRYPQAVWDDQLDCWISDAEVAEAEYTAFASKKKQAVTARLIVRRVRDKNKKAAGVTSGPLAHLPSGVFTANAAWLSIAAMAHNPLRAAGTLASLPYAKARAATIRRDLIAVAARTARHGRGHLALRLPEGWHREQEWRNLRDAARGPPATTA